MFRPRFRAVRLYSLRRIPSVVHPELQSNHAPERILILDPAETADKRFRQVVRDIGSFRPEITPDLVALASLDLLQDAQLDGRGALDGVDHTGISIEQQKPAVSFLTAQQHKELCDTLTRSYTKTQLQHFLVARLGTSRGLQRRTKIQLAQLILEKAWNITTGEPADLNHLVRTKSVELSPLDRFLLVLKSATLLRHVARAGAKIELGSKNLVFTGTDFQVKDAENLLRLVLDRCYRTTVDLLAIKLMFDERNHDFAAAVAAVSQSLGVFFKPNAQEGVFDFAAFDSSQIQRSQRMLMSMLVSKRNELKYLPNFQSKDFSLVPFADDESLPWHSRKPFYVARITQPRGFIQEALAKLDVDEKTTPSFDYEKQLYDAKSLPPQRDLEEESWNLLRDLGIVEKGKEKEEGEEVSEEKEVTEVKEVSGVQEVSEIVSEPKDVSDVSEAKKDSDRESPDSFSTKTSTANFTRLRDFASEITNNHYDFLTSFKSTSLPSSTMFTVGLGNILFPAPKSSTIIPKFGDNLSEVSRFSTNAATLIKKLVQLPFYENPDASLSSQAMVHDPHTYVAQIRFVPSPFDHVDHEEFPPVEIWVELNDRSKADVDTLSMVSVEGENECLVGLPQEILDMKVSCQKTGDLLKVESESPHHEKHSIYDLLQETAPRYSRFDSQPGLSEFLDNSRLDFGGSQRPSICPFIDINFGEKKLRYLYVNVNYRKQLEFRYGDRLIQMSTVEGGSMGGRTTEVTFVGENEDKQELQELLIDSRLFLEECI